MGFYTGIRFGLELNDGDYSACRDFESTDNLGFELGTFDGWARNVADLQTQAVITNEDKHSGQYSGLTLRQAEDTAGYWTTLAASFMVDAGQAYKVSYWLKQDGAAQVHSRLAYFSGDDFKGIQGLAPTEDGTHPWRKSDGVLVIPETVNRAELQVMHINPSSGVGKVWLDDVEFVEADEDNVGGLVLVDNRSNSVQQLVSTANCLMSANTWYWFRISVNNATIIVESSLDGESYEQIVAYNLQDDASIVPGFIGLYSGCSNTYFADVSVQ